MSQKFKMLWVYQEISANGRKTEAGQIPTLCYRGRKYLLGVSYGRPVRVVKREVRDFDRLRPVAAPLELKGKGLHFYPVEHAVKQFREIASRCGITEGAKAILDKAELSLTESVELDDEQFTNEEVIVADETVKTETETPAKPAKEKTVSKKTKKAAKPAKSAKKATPAKKAAGNGLGREGTLSHFINERLMKGQSNQVIADAAKKAFPKSNSTEAKHVAWSRWNLGRHGVKVPAVKD